MLRCPGAAAPRPPTGMAGRRGGLPSVQVGGRGRRPHAYRFELAADKRVFLAGPWVSGWALGHSPPAVQPPIATFARRLPRHESARPRARARLPVVAPVDRRVGFVLRKEPVGARGAGVPVPHLRAELVRRLVVVDRHGDHRAEERHEARTARQQPCRDQVNCALGFARGHSISRLPDLPFQMFPAEPLRFILTEVQTVRLALEAGRRERGRNAGCAAVQSGGCRLDRYSNSPGRRCSATQYSCTHRKIQS